MYLPFTVTGNVIGKATEKNGENDGLVSVISSQHPFNRFIQKQLIQIKKVFGK